MKLSVNPNVIPHSDIYLQLNESDIKKTSEICGLESRRERKFGLSSSTHVFISYFPCN